MYTDTATGNQYEAFPTAWAAVPVSTGGSGGSSGVVAPGTSVIQAALNVANPGDVVTLAPGTFVENGGIEIPNNIHLRGSGKGISVIKSSLIGSSAPFHGIVAPGNNSIISDLSIVGVSPTNGSGSENINAFSRRTGCTKSWTNVEFRNCYMYGIADCVISDGTGLGDVIFTDCMFDGYNDIVMWQSSSVGTFNRCEFRHTVLATFEFVGSLLLLNAGGTVRCYGCRFKVVGGTSQTFVICAEAQGPGKMEVYDSVIDYSASTLPFAGGSFDVSADDPDSLYINNVRRADGQPLVYRSASTPSTELKSNPSVFVVAKLPIHPVIGQIATVSDGTGALAWGATVTGGGSTKYLVVYNGANWTVLGK
jgi:hypothetical protein